MRLCGDELAYQAVLVEGSMARGSGLDSKRAPNLGLASRFGQVSLPSSMTVIQVRLPPEQSSLMGWRY